MSGGLGVGGRIARGNKAPRCRISWAGGFSGGHVPEDTATSTTLGTLTGHDPDGDAVTLSIASDPDSKFTLVGSALKLNAALDFAVETSHAVTIKAQDTHGAYTERTFTVTVTDAEEGGGGAPEWVPEGSVIYIDLIGNRAWSEADGLVDVDTLLGNDPNSDGFVGATLFDEENITADGYVSMDYVALIGEARTLFFAGCSMIFGTKTLDAGMSVNLTANNLAFDHVLSVDGTFSGGDLTIFPPGGAGGTEEALINISVGSLNKFGLTYEGARWEAAANNAGNVAHTLIAGEVGDPPDVLAVALSGILSGHAIQYIALRAPFASKELLQAATA